MRFVVIIICLLNLLCAQSNELQIAPLNPDFVKYQEDKKMGLMDKSNSEGYYNGIIPHPTDYKIDTPRNYKINISLPERYDLRDYGLVTGIRDQGQCGSCWTFATMGSIESRWKQLGFGSYNLSENNLANEHGFVTGPCEGGNANMSTAYLTRGDGPVSEDDDKYPYGAAKMQYDPTFDPLGIVTEARFLPNDMNVIKQWISDYGAIHTSMDWFDDFNDYYNQTDYTYFFSSNPDDPTNTGHAILLVGWDDNKQTAGGIGTWIIKNSWGNNFGEDGYFYISYQEAFINKKNIACWPERHNYNQHSTIYYYDKLGHLSDLGYSNDIAHALVKYTINNDETLMEVGTYAVRGNSQLSFDIWDDFNGGVLSNQLGNISIKSCDYPGYYTYDIPNPIEVAGGEDIYIRVKYQTSGYGMPIPIEKGIENYANPQKEAEGFWISHNGSSNSWTRISGKYLVNGKDDTPYDPCVKLYSTETAYASVKDEFSDLNNFKLDQNYPNPFNPTTSVTFEVPHESNIGIVIYDLLGNKVRILLNEYKSAGQYTIDWDGTDQAGQSVSGGIYFYKLQAGDFIQTRKMVLLK